MLVEIISISDGKTGQNVSIYEGVVKERVPETLTELQMIFGVHQRMINDDQR
jgi:hypothetical protein